MENNKASNTPQRLPEWMKVRMPGGPNYIQLRNLLKDSQLHTVCEEARCPNIGECWEARSATFMILGDVCTRRCHYCAVTTGKPIGIDINEPERLAQTVARLGLNYCVITSVNRDDLVDGGALVFAACIRKIRELLPHCKVEVLIPDFGGSWKALGKVMDAKPDVLNHNIESVRRVFPGVRPLGGYDLSLELLEQAKRLDPDVPTKSGIIVGMGEDIDEVTETMKDLRGVDCDLLTIGQYLRPSPKHLPVSRYYTPTDFEKLAETGRSLGFRHVASGPLVRSSYHADRQHEAASRHPALS
ncbi:MAG: lipoyl synthase [Dehalococcoidia bacterium]|nr:lipoyl synthase [Dehalococcoidia bacterium]